MQAHMILEIGAGNLVLGTCNLVLGACNLVLGTCNLVLGTCNLVLGTSLPICPSTKFPSYTSQSVHHVNAIPSA